MYLPPCKQALKDVKLKASEIDSVILIGGQSRMPLVLSQAISVSNPGELDEMVVVEFTLPATVDPIAVRYLAYEIAVASPYVFLREPVSIAVEDHYSMAHLTVFKIKAYVVDIRLERVTATDVILRLKKEFLDSGFMTA